jgi:hypothetical protein
MDEWIPFFYLIYIYVFLYLIFSVISLQCTFNIIIILSMFTCKNNSKHNNNNSLCFNFSLQKCLISNMGIYNFICGPRSYDAITKWPARSFGLATPGLDNVGSLTSPNPTPRNIFSGTHFC